MSVPHTPLKLFARSDNDINVLSTCLQDCVLQVGDMRYLPDTRQFVLVVNRYCWEHETTALRVRSALQFSGVENVQRLNIAQQKVDAILSLLALRFEPNDAPAGDMRIIFSGGGEIRLAVEACAAILEDITQPWPATRRPVHPVN